MSPSGHSGPRRARASGVAGSGRGASGAVLLRHRLAAGTIRLLHRRGGKCEDGQARQEAEEEAAVSTTV